jgi:hypothetical protein
MRAIRYAAALLSVCLLTAAAAEAAEIRGQYLEARTCDVFTGPCFANAEMGMAGKEAVLAWKVDEGSWNGVSLTGLGVALVLKAENTLGDDGIFPMDPGKIKSVILVDEKATQEQQVALVDFVKETAAAYTREVQKIEPAPIVLENDHDTAQGVFKAGKIAEIRTRRLGDKDCICTNETVYFNPLVDVTYPLPAYSLTQSYSGNDLDSKWTHSGSRSAFLAVFRK